MKGRSHESKELRENLYQKPSVLTVPWLLTTLQGERVLSVTSISQIRRLKHRRV